MTKDPNPPNVELIMLEEAILDHSAAMGTLETRASSHRFLKAISVLKGYGVGALRLRGGVSAGLSVIRDRRGVDFGSLGVLVFSTKKFRGPRHTVMLMSLS